jgi:hypothetical protein
VALALVDDEHPGVRVALRLQRIEEARERFGAIDRRDDEVERRKLPRHAP